MRIIDADKLLKDIKVIELELLKNKQVAIECEDEYMLLAIDNQLNAINRINGRVNSQPTSDRWIPVSERLPELSDDERIEGVCAKQYQVTVKTKKYILSIGCYYDFYSKKFKHPCYPGGSRFVNAIAWMDMTEPYMEAANEQ